jgi:hypothetical protein
LIAGNAEAQPFASKPSTLPSVGAAWAFQRRKFWRMGAFRFWSPTTFWLTCDNTPLRRILLVDGKETNGHLGKL